MGNPPTLFALFLSLGFLVEYRMFVDSYGPILPQDHIGGDRVLPQKSTTNGKMESFIRTEGHRSCVSFIFYSLFMLNLFKNSIHEDFTKRTAH